MNILGISALYHDSAAALCHDGEITAAAQEERFTRKKHDSRFPVKAIQYCLNEGKLSSGELDAVVYYDHPLLTLDRYIKNFLAIKGVSDELFKNNYESVFGKRLWIHKIFKDGIGELGKNNKLLVTEHHISHAASAFYPSPFEEAAILTIDGVGEWATTTIGVGKEKEINILKQIDYPHSLGLLYSAFTYLCGFKVNSGDYKFMGLAPYGKPVYYNTIRDNIIDLKKDGSFRLNLEYFDFYKKDDMINEKLESLLGTKRREPESAITKKEMDIAASVQKVLEEAVILLAKEAQKVTGASKLCMAGGVALNCVANGKLLREKLFDDMWIQPAAGDAGGALGAALYAMHHHYGVERAVRKRSIQKGSYLGPAFSGDSIKKVLAENNCVYAEHPSRETVCKETARLLAAGKIVGLFNGRMEFGPRALGGRSIIADPRLSEMQSKLNLKIKYRESFRPFAPSVLAERTPDYFELEKESPYMLLVADVQKGRQKPFNLDAFIDEVNINMLPVVNKVRSDIPAVTHVDYSARIQTVSKADNPYYHLVIEEFEKLTGCGVIVNTSFNVRGEPIVLSPFDAFLCFMRTEMDALVLENFILLKAEQPEFEDAENWRDKYGLD